MIKIDEVAIISVEKALCEAFATGKTVWGLQLAIPVPTPSSIRKAANLALNSMVMDLFSVNDCASSSAITHVDFGVKNA